MRIKPRYSKEKIMELGLDFLDRHFYFRKESIRIEPWPKKVYLTTLKKCALFTSRQEYEDMLPEVINKWLRSRWRKKREKSKKEKEE